MFLKDLSSYHPLVMYWLGIYEQVNLTQPDENNIIVIITKRNVIIFLFSPLFI
ncbi:hypothetical protein GF374_03100 [Candidatus Woesearchaeota archaeon]|nr:hypothetical protein [Candidatus Woesearchaeota archaeon]